MCSTIRHEGSAVTQHRERTSVALVFCSLSGQRSRERAIAGSPWKTGRFEIPVGLFPTNERRAVFVQSEEREETTREWVARHFRWI